MAAVSRTWTYHIGTPATLTATDGHALAPRHSVVPAPRHLSLVRDIILPFTAPIPTYASILSLSSHARDASHRLLRTCTGAQHVSVYVYSEEHSTQTQDVARQDVIQNSETPTQDVLQSTGVRDDPTHDVQQSTCASETPTRVYGTWLARCSRLRTLEWLQEENMSETYDDTPHRIETCHALAQLPASLTELRLDIRPAWWEHGVYEPVMRALPPLSTLHLSIPCGAYPPSHDITPPLSTWHALAQRHAASLRTLHIHNHTWTWREWGQLAHLTCITQLRITGAMMPMEAGREEDVAAVRVQNPIYVCTRVLCACCV